MSDSPSFFDRFNAWVRASVTLKLAIISFLILLLLIPESMLQSLITERLQLRDEAIAEVSSKWGGPQTIGGPVISIPYLVTSKDEKNNTVTTKEYAHFLPDKIAVTGNVTPEKRYRGIYVVVLYNGKMHLQGKFSKLNYEAAGVSSGELLFNEAVMTVGITDMKGIKNKIQVRLNGKDIEAEPGTISNQIFASGINIPLAMTAKDTLFDFALDLDLNGSSEINFLPMGKETDVTLSSKWGNPSFQGDFLPDSRDIKANEFSASWHILQLNRNYPQQGTGNFIGNTGSDFGVKFILPVDEYQKTTRSAKYGIMFIIITFLSFFFIEILNKRRIHPIQYLLVGFAVVLFYLLLLSISEHISFDLSYLISSVVILALISSYAWFVFANKKLTIVFSGILAILYAFFYSLLQLQDYSLLLGSGGLLLILAAIMYLTRRIDWYNWNKE
jgi:inner membrane protein